MAKKTAAAPAPKVPKCGICNGFGEICDKCGDDEEQCSCEAEAAEASEEYEASFSECEECGGTES